MSKKSSKVNFRDYFPKRGVPVAPAPTPDEEAGSSQESRQQRTVFESTLTIANENEIHSRIPSSKTSLPNTFGKKKKNKLNHILQFGSDTVRSVVTPPRSSATSKVDIERQGTSADNNNDETHDSNNNDEEKDEKDQVKPSASKDSATEYCRICHDNPSKLVLSSPCLCKGTMGMVHLSCLEHWLGESGKNHCEICGYEYVTQRKPKYSGCNSIFHWLRHPLSPADTRNFVFDLACFLILTPLAGVSAWLCILGAQHYTYGQDKGANSANSPAMLNSLEDSALHNNMRFRNHNFRYGDGSNSTWTSVGLLTLTGTLIAAYIVWVVVAYKFHLQVYRDWRSKNYIVTIVPMSQQEHEIAQAVRDTDIAFSRSRRNNPDANVTTADNNNNDMERAIIEHDLQIYRNHLQRRMELEFQRPEFIEFQRVLHSSITLDMASANAMNNNNGEVEILVQAIKGKSSCCSVSPSDDQIDPNENDSDDSIIAIYAEISTDAETRNRNRNRRRNRDVHMISNQLTNSSSSATSIMDPLQETHRTNSSP